MEFFIRRLRLEKSNVILHSIRHMNQGAQKPSRFATPSKFDGNWVSYR